MGVGGGCGGVWVGVGNLVLDFFAPVVFTAIFFISVAIAVWFYICCCWYYYYFIFIFADAVFVYIFL